MSSVRTPVAQESASFVKATRAWFLASALYDGIEDEDLCQIKTLLEDKGADPNLLLPDYGIAPFHLVVGNPCKAFALKATQLCLLAGANPNVRSEEGLTPVHVTAIWGRVEVLELLLKNGGDPWLVDDEKKMNAFQYAQQEEQWGTYDLMSVFCGLDDVDNKEVQNPSPCTLELKRVHVYKNDLCVEYEAVSLGGTKSNRKVVSKDTMTSPQYSNCKSVSVQTTTPPQLQNVVSMHTKTQPQLYDKRAKQILRNQKVQTHRYEECTCLDDYKEFDWCKEQHETHANGQAVQIIRNHRKKTVVYESVPTKRFTSEPEARQDSYRKNRSYNNPNFKTNLITEIRKKFDSTNKVRTFYEATGTQNDQNVENKMYTRSECPLNGKILCKKSMNNFEKCDGDGVNVMIKNPSRRNIDLVNDEEKLLTEYASSDAGSQCNLSDEFKTQTDEMNLGFILDPNNLISDISSNIDIQYTAPQEENIMTEDECVQEIQISSSTSNPYVTCTENSDNNESNLLAYIGDDVRISGVVPLDLRGLEDGEENCELDDLVSEGNQINCDLQSPSTSTPDILDEPAQEGDSICSTHAVSGSPCGELGKEYERQLNSKKWVKAEILNTSDKDEQEMSISEEYKYTDTEEGIELIEKRYLFHDVSVPVIPRSKEAASRNDVQNRQTSSDESDVSSLSRNTAAYDTDALRKELQERGFAAGPITGSTKRVYLRRLKRYRRKPPPAPEVNIPSYSCELSRTLTAVSLQQLLTDKAYLEQEMCSVFELSDKNAKWREGIAKTSFTYLLLDPRITRNLPVRAQSVPANEVWSDFLQAIFYIGKGKRSRPYSHLYQAVSSWNGKKEDNSEKVQRILDIWRSGLGVVCLHVFQNIIPVDAYTREAAMISALSLPRLTNAKAGDFYGPASTWQQREKRQLGVILLHRAYQMFLAEGERQLRPCDIE